MNNDKAKVNRDKPAMGADPEPLDRHNSCQCCRTVVPVDEFIKYLWLCVYCSENCNRADGKCIRGLCSCEGGCSKEHAAGEQCEDAATILFGVVGGIAKAVCVSCVTELIKRLVTP